MFGIKELSEMKFELELALTKAKLADSKWKAKKKELSDHFTKEQVKKIGEILELE